MSASGLYYLCLIKIKITWQQLKQAGPFSVSSMYVPLFTLAGLTLYKNLTSLILLYFILHTYCILQLFILPLLNLSMPFSFFFFCLHQDSFRSNWRLAFDDVQHIVSLLKPYDNMARLSSIYLWLLPVCPRFNEPQKSRRRRRRRGRASGRRACLISSKRAIIISGSYFHFWGCGKSRAALPRGKS